MSRRRETQQQHERAVVLDFLRWFKGRRKVAFRVIDYLGVAKQHGPGYLVVNIDYPLLDRRAHRGAKEEWAKGRPWPDNGCFKEVFLRMRSLDGYAFQRWVL